jgi:hypothetical protein
MSSYTKAHCIKLAKDAVEKLRKTEEEGVPECYGDYGNGNPGQNMMTDWWMDLPWNEEGQDIALDYIKSQPELKVIVERFEKKWDVKILNAKSGEER